jgi:serine/threonine protein kinase
MQVPYLERYEILQTLGQGGMGVVYLARQKKLDRLVAIKAISPYLAQEPEVRERFAAEASVLARLSHPNIVTLYDYIEEPDALYLVMEYVEGKPLSEILKAGPLPLESIRKYFTQILDAFDYAHSKGVIHRDIKPSNIIITSQGQVKILDFGVAKILSSDHSQTRTGMRLGTLMYMSPEQVKGEKTIDARSDIYSLGVVLFEMLTGKPPYDPELGEFEMSLRIVREPLFDLSHPPANIPQKILEVILHATEKNPEHRFSSCAEFREAFEGAFKEGISSPMPPTEVALALPAPASKDRKKFWIKIAGGIAVFILGIVLLTFWWGRRASNGTTSLADSFAADTSSVASDTPALRTDTLTAPSESSQSGLSEGSSQKASTNPETSPKSPIPSTTPSVTSSPRKASPSNPSTSALSSPSPADTSPQAHPPIHTPSFQEALKVEVQNFKKHGILQVKADLILTNSSPKSWKNIQIVVRFINKEDKVKRTETLQVAEMLPYGRWEKKLDYLVGGTARIEAEVVAAEPGP